MGIRLEEALRLFDLVGIGAARYACAMITRRHAFGLAALAGLHIAGCTNQESKAANGASTATGGVYDFEAKTIDGETVKLGKWAGKVLLIVNVASKCGFTPQYEPLQTLYKKHESEGLVILAFPSDQFGSQEPGTNAEIKTFCETRYAVTFPLFAKVDVNGDKAIPLYRYLRAEQKGGLDKNDPDGAKLYEHLSENSPEILDTDVIKWNFTKFLVDRHGRVVKRFESYVKPEALEPELQSELAKE